MFSGYNENFPYAYVTDRLVRAFPTWSKIRKDPSSIGAQFLNVTGLRFVEIDRFLQAALDNQYINSANIGEVSYIFKVKSNNQDLDSAEIFVGYDMSATPEAHILTECHTLFEFYAAPSDAHVFIIDFQTKIIYFRQEYSRVEIDSEVFNGVTPHHVWNVFDEFAMLLGLSRRYRETNAELKERILDIFRFPGNSTRLGLIRAIGRELGLVYKGTWPRNTDSFIIDEVAEGITIIPETIIVNGRRIKPSQYQYNPETGTYTIYPIVKVFYDEELDYRIDNVRLTTSKHLVLIDGVKDGYLITPIINPSNLKRWRTIHINATGSVKVDVVKHDFETYALQKDAYYARELEDGDPIVTPGSSPLPIDGPIRLIVNLSRELRTDPSPCLIDITLTYSQGSTIKHTVVEGDSLTSIAERYGVTVQEIMDETGIVSMVLTEGQVLLIPAHSEVSCIHDVGLEALHDDEFRNSLFDITGAPAPKLVNYVQELNNLVPIMWGKWKWDEGYWDVVGKNLMGLHVLPNKWDPRLGEISNIYFQSGIGYGLDCFVKFANDSWTPSIHSGYYYISITEDVVTDGTDIIYTTYPKPQFINVQDAYGKNFAVIEAKGNLIKISPVPLYGTTLKVTFSTENYLYANPVECIKEGPVSQFVLTDNSPTPNNAFPMQGAPVIVRAGGIYLKQVAFLDENYNISLTNTEKIAGNGTNQIALTYTNPIDITIPGYDVQDIDENVLTLNNIVPAGEEVTISYKVKDSFIIEYTDDSAIIKMSDIYSNISVIYESQDQSAYFSVSGPLFDPVVSHINSGFLFITNEVLPVADINISCSPDTISGNGVDIATIIVDTVDKWGNPCLNQNIAYTVEVNREDTGEFVGTGTLSLTGSYYNRKVYTYVSPVDLPPKEDGSGRIIRCIALITFTCGSIQKTTGIRVR